MCERTAVCRIESGPEVNSCSSRTEISYSLRDCQYDSLLARQRQRQRKEKQRLNRVGWLLVDIRELCTGLVQQVSVALLASTAGSDVIEHVDESHTGSLRRPSSINGGLAALFFRAKVIDSEKSLCS